ncbi:hypothetical protein D6D05_05865 [Aureobasidium pullulans]|nr:hypothetical protein D6D05_05865 [Aureobasidium pullulans]
MAYHFLDMFVHFDGYGRRPGYVFGRRAVSGLVDVYRSRADIALVCVSDDTISQSTFGSGGWVL